MSLCVTKFSPPPFRTAFLCLIESSCVAFWRSKSENLQKWNQNKLYILKAERWYTHDFSGLIRTKKSWSNLQRKQARKNSKSSIGTYNVFYRAVLESLLRKAICGTWRRFWVSLFLQPKSISASSHPAVDSSPLEIKPDFYSALFYNAIGYFRTKFTLCKSCNTELIT